MPKYKKIPIDVSIYVRYLHQDKGEDLKDLILRYSEYSKTSFHRHSKLPIGVNQKDGRYQNKGRKRLLSDRGNRKIIQCSHELRDTVGNFTSTDIQKNNSLKEPQVSSRTIRKSLRRLGLSSSNAAKIANHLKMP